MTDESRPNFFHLMLGLPEDSTSPDHYELLHLERFESDERRIREAAIDANQKLLAWQNSQYHTDCDHLMDMVVHANDVLLDAQEKTSYDEQLRERLGGDRPVDEVPLVAKPRGVGNRIPQGAATAEKTAPVSGRVFFFGLGGLIAFLLIGVAVILVRDSGEPSNPAEFRANTELAVTASGDSGAGGEQSSVEPGEDPSRARAGESTANSGATVAAAVDPSFPPLLQSPFKKMAATEKRNLWATTLAIQTEVTNSVEMDLILIPPGKFQMGSPQAAPAVSKGEKPQHAVGITKPFFLQTTEVTQGQWESVMGTKPWEGKTDVKKSPDCAACYVSWDDAVEFCRRLSEKESGTYRLPTEAEWEYACRAGTTTAYHFGDDASELGDYAWFHDSLHDDQGYAREVRQKKANAFGLYDMHGNVSEWCEDWYEEEYYENSPASDPTGASSGSSRVNRGGGWYSPAQRCRSAMRRKRPPDYRSSFFGFRVVRSPVR